MNCNRSLNRPTLQDAPLEPRRVAWTDGLGGAEPKAHKESSMRTRRSKSPLPPVLPLPVGTAPDLPLDDSIPEQVGGGHRQASPLPQETPTRLRTRIKASEKARENVVVQQAERRRARLGNETVDQAPSQCLQVPVADGSDPITAIYLGRHQAPLACSAAAPPLGQHTLLAPSIAGESCEQGTHQRDVPATHVIPPTPAAAASSGNAVVLSGQGTTAGSDGDTLFIGRNALNLSTPMPAQTGGDVNPDHGSTLLTNIDEPSTPTSGRRTAAVNSTLAAGYDQLEDILSKLVEETSLTPQQVLEGWNKSRGRTVNGINHWNLYTRYALKHEEQERKRLPDISPDTQLTPNIRGQLYTKFKEDNKNDWQEILELHDQIENGQSSSPQTIAQRAQTFNKFRKRVIAMLESESARHGFESAIVMCGSVVHEDGQLGFAHTTGGATGYFETRCRAPPNSMIAHLKAHVYNHVSLETVNEAFGSEEISNLVPAAGPRTQLEMVDDPDKHVADGAASDSVMAYIKDSLLSLIQSAGGDVSKFKRGTFPWATLLSFLTAEGLVMRGWPDGVLMPGQLRHPGARTKGIADLNHADRRRLQQVLTAREITVTKLTARAERRDLSEFNAPVVIGAAPPAGSQRAKALQMYGNGTIDYNGPDRLSRDMAAATRIKQKPARMRKIKIDTPIVIGSSSEDGPHVIPVKNHMVSDEPIVITSSDDARLPALKKIKLAAPLHAKATVKKGAFFVLDSSDEEADNFGDIEEDEHVTAAVGESRGDDYHEASGESRKRKASKPLLPGKTLKKPTLARELAKIRKGKGVEGRGVGNKKAKFKSAKWVDVSDESETETQTVKEGSQTSSQALPKAGAATYDVFGRAETIGPSHSVVAPSAPAGPSKISKHLVEPTTPSPKRNKGLEPLTELEPSCKIAAEIAVILPAQSASALPAEPSTASTGRQTVTLPQANPGLPPAVIGLPNLPNATSTSAGDHVHVPIPNPALPLDNSGNPPAVVAPPSIPPNTAAVIPQAAQINFPADTSFAPAGNQVPVCSMPNPTLNSGHAPAAVVPLSLPNMALNSGFPLTAIAHPTLPPNPTAGRDEMFRYAQVGGGYQSQTLQVPQAPYLPYGSDGQQGLMDSRNRMYFDTLGAHRDNAYRGVYGGCYPSDEWQRQTVLGHGFRSTHQSNVGTADPQQPHSRQTSLALADVQQGPVRQGSVAPTGVQQANVLPQ